MFILSQDKDYLIDSSDFPSFGIDNENAIWAYSKRVNLFTFLSGGKIDDVCLGQYSDEKAAVKEIERLAEALAEGTEKIFRFS